MRPRGEEEGRDPRRGPLPDEAKGKMSARVQEEEQGEYRRYKIMKNQGRMGCSSGEATWEGRVRVTQQWEGEYGRGKVGAVTSTV